MQYHVQIGGRERTVVVETDPAGGLRFAILDPNNPGDRKWQAADAMRADGAVNVVIDGRVLDLDLSRAGDEFDVFYAGRSASVVAETDRERATRTMRAGAGAAGGGAVKSPMPGKVVKVLVSEDQRVEAGTPLAVVEAMKMENELLAEAAGVVNKVHVSAGDAVEGGATLISITVDE